jgi:hypothetical protein
MTGLTPEQILATPPGDLANQSSDSLFDLKGQATALLTTAKAVDAWIDKALDLKYSQRAREIRLAEGKDTGVVHFEDGPVHVTVDLPKKVEWDQARLADITRRIAEGGEDPRQYVAISYRVSETKFNAWPEAMRSAFVAARTLKTGKPEYRLSEKKGVTP